MSFNVILVLSSEGESEYIEGVFSEKKYADDWRNVQNYPEDYYIQEMQLNPPAVNKYPPSDSSTIPEISESKRKMLQAANTILKELYKEFPCELTKE